MIGKSLKNIWQCEQLRTIACQHFKKTILNWQEQCYEETAGIKKSEFNGDGLILISLKIDKIKEPGYNYKIEAKYTKKFSNNTEVIYIIKFFDDLTIYDDVFYTNKNT